MPINFPDIQQLLRLKRIFDPENNPGGPYWNPAREGVDEVENDIFPVGQSNNQPMLDRSMSDMPTFSTPANDEFNRFIGEFPQREQPGKLRRVGAFVAALGSNNPMQTVDDYLNFNYNQKLSDWRQRAPFLQNAANLERQSNTALSSQAMADRRLDETERRNLVLQQQKDRDLTRLEEKDKATLDLNNRKLALARFKAENKDYILKTRLDGMIVGINPQDPSKTVETKVMSNELSDMEKITYGLDADLQKIQASGNVQSGLIEQRGEVERDLIGARGEETRKNIATPRPPRASTTAGETEQARKVRLFNKAQEAANTHPEWKKYIKLQTSNNFSITPPGNFMGVGPATGPTKSDYDKINNFIYGTTSRTGGTTNVNTDKKYIPDANGVMVLNPNYKGGK